MTGSVKIAPVQGYGCTDEIRAFVESAFESNPGIGALLATRPADRLVVVKPNWVQEAHEYESQVWEPEITHPQLPGEPSNE